MTPATTPSKPSKLKRVLKLRPIEWAPILAGALINMTTGLWFAFSLTRGFESFGSSDSDSLARPFYFWNIASHICAVLFLVGFGSWVWRAYSIIREQTEPEFRQN